MSLPPATKYLIDWFVRYTKNRDLVFRKISDIKEEGNKVIISQKDGKKITYHIEPFPEDIGNVLPGAAEEEAGIVMYNSKENFDKMMAAWKKLSAMRNLSVYLVNPFSKLEKRWIVKPHVHSKISEAEALKEGLNSMYMMVEPISEQELEELTK